MMDVKEEQAKAFGRIMGKGLLVITVISVLLGIGITICTSEPDPGGISASEAESRMLSYKFEKLTFREAVDSFVRRSPGFRETGRGIGTGTSVQGGGPVWIYHLNGELGGRAVFYEWEFKPEHNFIRARNPESEALLQESFGTKP